MSENDTKSTCISEMAFFNLGKIKDTLKEFRSLVLKFQQVVDNVMICVQVL